MRELWSERLNCSHNASQKVKAGSHLRTLALKTENFSAKTSVLLVKREMDLVERSSPYFSRVFCPGDGFSKSIFAFY